MAKIDFSDAVTRIVDSYLREHTYTAMPGKIIDVSRYQTNQVVSVQPLLNRKDLDGTIIECPPIIDVPIMFPGGAGGIVSFPVQNEDKVLLVFAMRSIDEYLDSTGVDNVTASDRRQFALGDAIAIPGLSTRPSNFNPDPVNMEIKFNGLSFRLEAGGDMVMENPSYSFTLKADGSVLHSSGAMITAAGDFVTANGISLDGHTHSQGNDSGGDSEVETNPPTV